MAWHRCASRCSWTSIISSRSTTRTATRRATQCFARLLKGCDRHCARTISTARLGGDEFVVHLDNVATPTVDVAQVADKLLCATAQSIEVNGQALRVHPPHRLCDPRGFPLRRRLANARGRSSDVRGQAHGGTRRHRQVPGALKVRRLSASGQKTLGFMFDRAPLLSPNGHPSLSALNTRRAPVQAGTIRDSNAAQACR